MVVMSGEREAVSVEQPAKTGSISPSLHSGLLCPADKVVIAYILLISLLIVIFNHRIGLWWQLLAGHVLAILAVALIAHRWRHEKSSLVRGWYPVALIPLTYKELTYLIPLVNPRQYDAELASLDYQMLGAHATLWLERFTFPLLTEILQICYACYYFLPIILGAVLWRKGWFDRFYFFVFIIVLAFYLSYIGYITVPVIGPRFYPPIQEAQSFPLSGVWLYQSIREMLDEAEGRTFDCFPSGHTALTLLVLYYARRFHRRTFWWMLPVGSALVFSTVYLRYHYVIDVLAGVLLALAVVIIAPRLYRALAGQVPGVRGRGPGPDI
jgi:membrane-associated phospholipid phosphatase